MERSVTLLFQGLAMRQQAATIHVEHIDDVVVINVGGIHCAPLSVSIEEAVTEVLNDGARRIVVDLSQTTRMDTEAIGDLVEAFGEAQNREAAFVVVLKLRPDPPGTIVCPHHPVLDLYDSREEALEALHKPSGGSQSPSRSWWSNWRFRRGR